MCAEVVEVVPKVVEVVPKVVEVVLYMPEVVNGVRGVLGGYALLCMLLRILEAVEGELRLLEVLE